MSSCYNLSLLYFWLLSWAPPFIISVKRFFFVLFFVSLDESSSIINSVNTPLKVARTTERRNTKTLLLIKSKKKALVKNEAIFECEVQKRHSRKKMRKKRKIINDEIPKRDGVLTCII